MRSGIEESLIGVQGLEELKKRKERLLEQFRGEGLQVMTPEGYVLDGAYFSGISPGGATVAETGPTVIYFNANMQLYESTSAATTVKMYTSKGMNVVLFNYRCRHSYALTLTSQHLNLLPCLSLSPTASTLTHPF